MLSKAPLNLFGSMQMLLMEQDTKALLAMLLTVSGISASLRFPHFQKAANEIVSTEDGILTASSPDDENAYVPIVLTQFPIVTDLRFEQYANA